jgi:hypothetical protein
MSRPTTAFTCWLFLLLFTLQISEAEDTKLDQPPEIQPPAWPEKIRTRNAAMKRRVDAWLKEGKESDMALHVVYLSCKDQEPFPGHKKRLNRVLSEIQTWYEVQSEAAGFGRTTFILQRNESGQVKLHEGKLPFTVESRNSGNKRETDTACRTAARALLAKEEINFDRSFVLVLTTIPDDHSAAPYYGNIIQDRGYCFAVDAPWLDLNYTQTDGPKVWKGKPAGAANSALIGGMAHELGHGFGLPHSDEPTNLRRFGESLMGSGNYTWREEIRGRSLGSFLLDTDAMLLIARPPFTGRVRDFDKQPKASVEDVKFENLEDGTVRVTGQIESDIPVHGVKIFDDPPGNNDYNAVAHPALPDEQTGEFSIVFTPIKAPGEHSVRLLLFHVNGRWSQFNTGMAVDSQGSADLSKANKELGGS